MIKVEELKYDWTNSTYAWKVPIRAEFDYRKIKDKPFIIEGCSKYCNLIEMEDVDRLLITNIAMLFDKGYIHKSIGVDVYQSNRGLMLRELSLNQRILTIRKKENVLQFRSYHWLIDHRVEEVIDRYCSNYNNGHYREFGLRVAR